MPEDAESNIKVSPYTMTLTVPYNEYQAVVRSIIGVGLTPPKAPMQYPGKPRLFAQGVNVFKEGEDAIIKVEFAELDATRQTHAGWQANALHHLLGTSYGLTPDAIRNLTPRQVDALVESA